jgi:hypothetical protein
MPQSYPDGLPDSGVNLAKRLTRLGRSANWMPMSSLLPSIAIEQSACVATNPEVQVFVLNLYVKH